ncbi:unnamed protein product, partial [Schistosoma turkestanicum]
MEACHSFVVLSRVSINWVSFPNQSLFLVFVLLSIGKRHVPWAHCRLRIYVFVYLDSTGDCQFLGFILCKLNVRVCLS